MAKRFPVYLLGLIFIAGSVLRVGAVEIWVDAKAAANGDGTSGNPFRTVQQAARLAGPGDVVHVRPGIYRERVMPERGGEPGKPIVYVSEVPHAAIIKGSDVWNPNWKEEGKGVFSGAIDEKLFTDNGYVDGGNPYRIRYSGSGDDKQLPPHPFKSVEWTLGQVFVDGLPLRECSSRTELTESTNAPGAWWFDAAADRILLNLNGASPRGRTLELTTRRGVFRPLKKGLGYLELRGFVFEHCANQFPANFWADMANEESGMVGTRSGGHWVIADNIFAYAKSIGLTFGGVGGLPKEGKPYDNEIPAQGEPDGGSVGYHRIEGNLFVSNGGLGAMGFRHTGVVFTNNVFLRNNLLANTDYETGGIKTHIAYSMVIERNWFIDNDCMGVWIDNTWQNNRISRNVFLGNRGQDVFFEMDNNTTANVSTVDHNIFLPGRPDFRPKPSDTNMPPAKWGPWSVGVYGHDADGVRIMRNLFAGKAYGIYFRKMTPRKGGSAFITAEGNIFSGPAMTAVCLPMENPPNVRSNHFDANLYPVSARPFAVTGWSIKTGEADPKIIAQLKESLKGDAAVVSFGDPVQPPAGFYLNFDEWKSIMKFDQQSRAMDVPFVFDRKTWKLTITLPAEMPRFPKTSPKLPGGDFFNKPAAAGSPVGPFENFSPGRHVVTLPAPSLDFLDGSGHW